MNRMELLENCTYEHTLAIVKSDDIYLVHLKDCDIIPPVMLLYIF